MASGVHKADVEEMGRGGGGGRGEEGEVFASRAVSVLQAIEC